MPKPVRHPIVTDCLLDFNLRASVFKLFLGGVGIGLIGTFQNRFRSTFNQRFGFREAQTGLDFANSLNHSDLLVSWNRSQDDIERCLGFGGGSSSSTTGR